MTTPTPAQLHHLANRARDGVALPAEHDQLAAGITAMAARITTLEQVAESNKRAYKGAVQPTGPPRPLSNGRGSSPPSGLSSAPTAAPLTNCAGHWTRNRPRPHLSSARTQRSRPAVRPGWTNPPSTRRSSPPPDRTANP